MPRIGVLTCTKHNISFYERVCTLVRLHAWRHQFRQPRCSFRRRLGSGTRIGTETITWQACRAERVQFVEAERSAAPTGSLVHKAVVALQNCATDYEQGKHRLS